MNDHDKVIQFIADKNADTYEVLANLNGDSTYRIGDYSPDLVLMTKIEPKRIVFVIEVSVENDLSSSVQKWSKNNIKTGTFYIIVQQSKVEIAKQLAAINAIKAKFGYYTINKENQVETVTYES